MLERMWGRGLHFCTLRVGDVSAYYSFGFNSGRWLLLYKPAFRLAYQKWSPGTVFVSLLIEEACRTGLEGIDFLLGRERFKYRWSTEEFSVTSIHASARAWSVPFQWFAHGKPLVLRHRASEAAPARE